MKEWLLHGHAATCRQGMIAAGCILSLPDPRERHGRSKTLPAELTRMRACAWRTNANPAHAAKLSPDHR
jgi:hypothetical protein